MDISVQKDEFPGQTPSLVRIRVPGTNEIGTILRVEQITSGPYQGENIATVLFESTGECRLYLNDRLDKL